MRRVTSQDLFRLQVVSDPQPRAGGVAYVVSWLEAQADERRSRIWLHGRPLTAGPFDLAPRWSPDGARLAFLRSPDGKNHQVHILPAGGGEAACVSHDLKGAMDLRWSPDGRRLAVLAHGREPSPATQALRAALDPDGDADRLSERQPDTQLRVTDRLVYRNDGLGYSDDRHRHVWLLDIESGNATQLTSGSWDVDGFDWHPDGRRIALIRNGEDGATSDDAIEVDADTGATRHLTTCAGGISALAWSPDGRRLALFGSDGRHGHATQSALFLHDGQNTANVTQAFDRAVGSALFGDARTMGLPTRPQWKGDQVVFTAIADGNVLLLACDLDGRIERLPLPTETGAASEPAVGPDGSLYFLWEDPQHPADIWCGMTRVTSLNDEVLKGLDLGPRERIAFAAPDGLAIEGWLTLPPAFDAAKRYPLVLYVHGGPHGSFGNSFSHEWHLRAAADRLVLAMNPRGSGGYGQAFVKACVGDWGGNDYLDLMAGLDAVIARGYVDSSRQAVTGISYGGFMTDWIITHTSRFRTAITEMCVSNLVSFYGTSDIGTHFAEFEAQGTPWEGVENLWNHSPMKYVGNCTTPTLVIHGESDYRCPIEQGEQFYASLRRRGVEAALIRVPGASHVFSLIGKPSQRVGRLRAMEAWLRDHGV